MSVYTGQKHRRGVVWVGVTTALGENKTGIRFDCGSGSPHRSSWSHVTSDADVDWHARHIYTGYNKSRAAATAADAQHCCRLASSARVSLSLSHPKGYCHYTAVSQ